MADQRDPMAGEQAAAERAPEQQGDSAWPRPGEEGYVHPDGTPQAARQLEENRQAAADRAAAGSIIDGAPSAARGGAPSQAPKRAEDYSGPTEQERRESLAEFVTEKRDEVAQEVAEAGDMSDPDAAQKRRAAAGDDRSAAPKTDKSTAAGPKPAGQTTR